jgi:hypothetical protein
VEVSSIHAWNINFVQSLEACQTEVLFVSAYQLSFLAEKLRSQKQKQTVNLLTGF